MIAITMQPFTHYIIIIFVCVCLCVVGWIHGKNILKLNKEGREREKKSEKKLFIVLTILMNKQQIRECNHGIIEK